jgi:uncharacterized protein with HEPN domain
VKSEGLDENAFCHDRLRRAATLRNLEIIGEASRRLSEGIKSAHPHVPWVDMLGLRNLLIHAYDRVDLKEIWIITQVDVPKLIESLRSIPGLTPDEEIE